MPIYEYECKACDTRFDKMQPIHAEPLLVCLNCGQGPVRRVYHPVGVIFKGSGWYITDSRQSAKKDGDSKSSSSVSSDKGGGGESASAKPSEAAAPSPSSADE